MTLPGHTDQHLIGRLRADKWAGPLIVGADATDDGGFEFSGAVMDAPPNLFFAQHGEPAFDRLHQGRAFGVKCRR